MYLSMSFFYPAGEEFGEFAGSVGPASFLAGIVSVFVTAQLFFHPVNGLINGFIHVLIRFTNFKGGFGDLKDNFCGTAF